MLDADFNCLNDNDRKLDEALAAVSIGIIPGAGLPENANRLPVTDGATNISWVLISDPYVEDASLSGSKLIPGTLTANEMMDGTIPKSKMGPKSVGTSNLEDLAVTGQKTAERTFPGSKMILHTITNDEIDDNAIDTDNVKDLAITTDKMANGNVTLAKLAQDVIDFLNALVPIGTIMEFPGSSGVSANWLECIGQPVSRATYATLFARIGVTYGSGDGSTTFNLPDRRGRVSVGIGSDNSTGGRITAATASSITLGGTFGEETHLLTVPEIPNHTHSCGLKGQILLVGGGADVSFNEATQGDSGSTGGGQAHNNVQPSIFMRYYIRAL
jgi:microcystin-dependent protein